MIYVNCNLCGHDEWHLLHPATVQNSQQPDVDVFRCTCEGYGEHPQIVRCLQCGHVYANPRWEAEQLVGAYAAVEDALYVREQAARRRTFEHHLHRLESFRSVSSPGTLLDVGAYTGVFLEVAEARGWKALGVEPSRWAAEVARSRGLDVVEGTLEARELQGRQFDAVTMWDVIEHVVDPADELVRTYELLAEGGVIAVHTMDINSLFARLMGRRWPWLMDMHVHYFSRDSLTRLLERTGYEVLWAGAEGRYLSLRYLASRLFALSPPLGRLFGGLVTRTGAADRLMPVNLGDLFTVYARRPGELRQGP
jgi:2-polyprenyl-3-methyl-5-hydroxy-6-metoxy-1,4-benzoquinol methylase